MVFQFEFIFKKITFILPLDFVCSAEGRVFCF